MLTGEDWHFTADELKYYDAREFNAWAESDAGGAILQEEYIKKLEGEFKESNIIRWDSDKRTAQFLAGDQWWDANQENVDIWAGRGWDNFSFDELSYYGNLEFGKWADTEEGGAILQEEYTTQLLEEFAGTDLLKWDKETRETQFFAGGQWWDADQENVDIWAGRGWDHFTLDEINYFGGLKMNEWADTEEGGAILQEEYLADLDKRYDSGIRITDAGITQFLAGDQWWDATEENITSWNDQGWSGFNMEELDYYSTHLDIERREQGLSNEQQDEIDTWTRNLTRHISELRKTWGLIQAQRDKRPFHNNMRPEQLSKWQAYSDAIWSTKQYAALGSFLLSGLGGAKTVGAYEDLKKIAKDEGWVRQDWKSYSTLDGDRSEARKYLYGLWGAAGSVFYTGSSNSSLTLEKLEAMYYSSNKKNQELAYKNAQYIADSVGIELGESITSIDEAHDYSARNTKPGFRTEEQQERWEELNKDRFIQLEINNQKYLNQSLANIDSMLFDGKIATPEIRETLERQRADRIWNEGQTNYINALRSGKVGIAYALLNPRSEQTIKLSGDKKTSTVNLTKFLTERYGVDIVVNHSEVISDDVFKAVKHPDARAAASDDSSIMGDLRNLVTPTPLADYETIQIRRGAIAEQAKIDAKLPAYWQQVEENKKIREQNRLIALQNAKIDEWNFTNITNELLGNTNNGIPTAPDLLKHPHLGGPGPDHIRAPAGNVPGRRNFANSLVPDQGPLEQSTGYSWGQLFNAGVPGSVFGWELSPDSPGYEQAAHGRVSGWLALPHDILNFGAGAERFWVNNQGVQGALTEMGTYQRDVHSGSTIEVGIALGMGDHTTIARYADRNQLNPIWLDNNLRGEIESGFIPFVGAAKWGLKVGRVVQKYVPGNIVEPRPGHGSFLNHSDQPTWIEIMYGRTGRITQDTPGANALDIRNVDWDIYPVRHETAKNPFAWTYYEPLEPDKIPKGVGYERIIKINDKDIIQTNPSLNWLLSPGDKGTWQGRPPGRGQVRGQPDISWSTDVPKAPDPTGNKKIDDYYGIFEPVNADGTARPRGPDVPDGVDPPMRFDNPPPPKQGPPKPKGKPRDMPPPRSETGRGTGTQATQTKKPTIPEQIKVKLKITKPAPTQTKRPDRPFFGAPGLGAVLPSVGQTGQSQTPIQIPKVDYNIDRDMLAPPKGMDKIDMGTTTPIFTPPAQKTGQTPKLKLSSGITTKPYTPPALQTGQKPIVGPGVMPGLDMGLGVEPPRPRDNITTKPKLDLGTGSKTIPIQIPIVTPDIDTFSIQGVKPIIDAPQIEKDKIEYEARLKPIISPKQKQNPKLTIRPKLKITPKLEPRRVPNPYITQLQIDTPPGRKIGGAPGIPRYSNPGRQPAKKKSRRGLWFWRSDVNTMSPGKYHRGPAFTVGKKRKKVWGKYDKEERKYRGLGLGVPRRKGRGKRKSKKGLFRF